MANEPSDVPDTSATVLYVGNLDSRVTDVMMLNILRAGLAPIAEKVLSAKKFAPSDPSQGPEGYCFIEFQDNNAACQAMTFLNGRDFCGKKVKVNWATNNQNGGASNYKILGSSVTIFVGDLDDEITDKELRKAFDPFGEILNAKVVKDSVTQKSKNYGFISFSNKPDAEKAIRDMHGAMLKRRPIKTNWATRNQKSQQSDLDPEQVSKEATPENCTVYVTNLPDRVTDEMILRHFEPYGTIVGKPRLFEGKNFCFIKYESHDVATKAIVEGNGSELNGAVLKCWWGKENATDNQNGPSSNYSNSNSGYQHNHQQNMSQQQMYQQYLQYYSNPMYQQQQQQYYQYWMHQYQQQMLQHQQAGGQGAAQQYSYQQQPQAQQYQQQQQAYAQQQPQGGAPQGGYPPNSFQS